MPANAHFTNPYSHQTRFTRFKLGLKLVEFYATRGINALSDIAKAALARVPPEELERLRAEQTKQ